MQLIYDGAEYAIEFTPINFEDKCRYSIPSPGPEFKPCFFKTATCDMRLLNRNGSLYFEHINVEGEMEILPFMGVHAGDDNFFNIGWENDKEVHYFRIDIYTGKSKFFVKKK